LAGKNIPGPYLNNGQTTGRDKHTVSFPRSVQATGAPDKITCAGTAGGKCRKRADLTKLIAGTPRHPRIKRSAECRSDKTGSVATPYRRIDNANTANDGDVLEINSALGEGVN
jgi:hypothetical protein